jgi:hypothetical protein
LRRSKNSTISKCVNGGHSLDENVADSAYCGFTDFATQATPNYSATAYIIGCCMVSSISLILYDKCCKQPSGKKAVELHGFLAEIFHTFLLVNRLTAVKTHALKPVMYTILS